MKTRLRGRSRFGAAKARPTHLGELFTIIERRLRGLPSGYAGTDRLDLALRRYRADSLSAVLTDPFDGRRYELVLRPLGKSLSARDGRTCRFP